MNSLPGGQERREAVVMKEDFTKVVISVEK